MQFISTENKKILSEIVYENITKDTVLFDKMFTDFGSRENGPVMLLNKKFLSILSDITNKVTEPKKVSFDQQYNNHKRNFMSYTPKHPEAPIFADVLPKVPLRNIDDIIKETVITRQYEIAPSGKNISENIEINSQIINRNTSPIDNITRKKIYIQPKEQEDISTTFIDSIIEDISIEPIINNTIDTEISNIKSQLTELHSILTGISSKLDVIETGMSNFNQYIKY